MKFTSAIIKIHGVSKKCKFYYIFSPCKRTENLDLHLSFLLVDNLSFFGYYDRPFLIHYLCLPVNRIRCSKIQE